MVDLGFTQVDQLVLPDVLDVNEFSIRCSGPELSVENLAHAQKANGHHGCQGVACSAVAAIIIKRPASDRKRPFNYFTIRVITLLVAFLMMSCYGASYVSHLMSAGLAFANMYWQAYSPVSADERFLQHHFATCIQLYAIGVTSENGHCQNA